MKVENHCAAMVLSRWPAVPSGLLHLHEIQQFLALPELQIPLEVYIYQQARRDSRPASEKPCE